jgi:hypothetical protein
MPHKVRPPIRTRQVARDRARAPVKWARRSLEPRRRDPRAVQAWARPKAAAAPPAPAQQARPPADRRRQARPAAAAALRQAAAPVPTTRKAGGRAAQRGPQKADRASVLQQCEGRLTGALFFGCRAPCAAMNASGTQHLSPASHTSACRFHPRCSMCAPHSAGAQLHRSISQRTPRIADARAKRVCFFCMMAQDVRCVCLHTPR